MHYKQKIEKINLALKYSLLYLGILSTLNSQILNMGEYPIIKQLDNNWVKVVVIVEQDKNKTRRTTEVTALDKAKKTALEFINGTRIRNDLDVYQNSKSGINISESIKEITSGKIDGKREGKYELFIDNDKQYIKLSIEILVGENVGIPDPNFELEVTLNKSNFEEGEDIIITIESSQNCYITIFSQSKCSLTAPVTVLFPHKFASNNYLKVGEMLTVPDNDDWALTMWLPKDVEKCVETITVVARKDSNRYWKYKEKISNNYNEPYQIAYETSNEKLMEWIQSAKVERITEAHKSYRIFKH